MVQTVLQLFPFCLLPDLLGPGGLFARLLGIDVGCATVGRFARIRVGCTLRLIRAAIRRGGAPAAGRVAVGITVCYELAKESPSQRAPAGARIPLRITVYFEL